MTAEVVRIDPQMPSPLLIEEAANVIRGKGVIIYPTETLYGLGINAFDPDAVEKLYAIKGRERDKPVLFLIRDQEMLEALVKECPPLGRELMERYWPGPLTLIFRAKEGLPAPVKGRDGTIGLRISSHPIARRIVEAVDAPITSTSANLAGAENITDALEIARHFGDRVDMIIDGGKVPGVGSTVVDLTVSPPVIVREGMIKGLLLRK